MDEEQRARLREIYKALAEPLPDEGIQRTKGSQTGRGYDTTGYGYQFAVNRFNEVCGLDGWGYSYIVLQEKEGEFRRSGGENWNIVTEVSIWVDEKDNVRTMPGSHIASGYGDALKGAITNAFKKAAAMWGVGREAYEGTIDEDNRSTGFAGKEQVASLQRIAADAGIDMSEALESQGYTPETIPLDTATELIRRWNKLRQEKQKEGSKRNAV